jgi:hypothetical protein
MQALVETRNAPKGQATEQKKKEQSYAQTCQRWPIDREIRGSGEYGEADEDCCRCND